MRQRLANLLLRLWLPIGLLVTWWLVTANSKSPFWPPLSKILGEVNRIWLFDHFHSDLVPTLRRVAIGYALAVVAGIMIGALLGASGFLLWLFQPTLEFLRAIPGVVQIPIFILLLGIGDTQKVCLILSITFWPILLNTIDGVRGIDNNLRETARVYKFRRRERLLNVVLPGSLPQVFAGMRVGLATAVLVTVFAELYASTNGVGHFILIAQSEFRLLEMWSGIIVLGVVAYFINMGFLLMERRVLYWHRGWRASVLGDAAPRGR